MPIKLYSFISRIKFSFGPHAFLLFNLVLDEDYQLSKCKQNDFETENKIICVIFSAILVVSYFLQLIPIATEHFNSRT